MMEDSGQNYKYVENTEQLRSVDPATTDKVLGQKLHQIGCRFINHSILPRILPSIFYRHTWPFCTSMHAGLISPSNNTLLLMNAFLCVAISLSTSKRTLTILHFQYTSHLQIVARLNELKVKPKLGLCLKLGQSVCKFQVDHGYVVFLIINRLRQLSRKGGGVRSGSGKLTFLKFTY